MPTSTRYTKFLGLDKSNDSVKFRVDPGGIVLEKAENVNISRTFSVERRKGYSLWMSGSFSSLWGNGSVCYAVDNGDLVELSLPVATKTVIAASVGSFSMSFADSRDGYVYYCNGVTTGKIKASVASSLGTTSDTHKATLPVGDFMAFLSPRLLVAKGASVYVSEVINKDTYHKFRGFFQFESKVRMIASIGQSFFVSDEKFTWFMRKTQSQLTVAAPMFKMEKVLDYPSIPGNVTKSLSNITTDKQPYPECIAWMSERGVCIGAENGSIEQITEKKYEMPASKLGGAMELVRANDLNMLISIIRGA